MAEQQDIPQHWTIATLGQVCLKSQYGWTSKAVQKGKLRYLRTTDISSETVNWENVPYCKIEPDFKEDFLLRDGDILISRSGSVGLSYLVDDIPYECVFASYMIRFIPFYVHSKYIYYFLQTDAYWKAINKEKSGVAMSNVNATQLSELKIPLPPLNEQREIAETLDDFFYQLDYYEKRLANIPKALEMYREMVLEQAVSGELTKEWRKENNIKNNWDNLKGNDVFNFITSGSRGWAKYYDDKGKIFIRITNLNYEDLNIDTSPSKLRYVNLPKQVEGKRTRVKEGDILISITGYLGMIGVVPKKFPEAYVNQHIALARPKENTLSNYIGLFLKSTTGQKQFKKMRRGTVKAGLSLQDIRNLQIPIPSLAEQKEIVHQVTTRLKKADRIEKEEYQNISYLPELRRKKVLEKAFNGTLVKPVEEEMNVEKLLATIKVEKAAIEQQRKQARKNRKRQPKPPKMTKEALKKFIQEEFQADDFNFEQLLGIVQNKARFSYDDLRDNFFDLLRPPLKDEEEAAFLEASFENGITFTIKPTKDETENS